MRNRKRGQAVTEFIVVIAIMVIYLIGFSLILSGQKAAQFYYVEALRARAVSESLAAPASAAYIAGNGSEIYVTLATASQEISMVSNLVQVKRSASLAQTPVLTSRVNSTFLAGDRKVSNRGGNITIG